MSVEFNRESPGKFEYPTSPVHVLLLLIIMMMIIMMIAILIFTIIRFVYTSNAHPT